MIRNRATEKDVRDYLTGVGYYGRSARIHELELAAVGQSGWVQVFEGHLEAKHEADGWREFFFVVRDDERQSFNIELFDEAAPRDERLTELSQGLMRRRGDREAQPAIQMIAAAVVVAGLLVLAVMQML